MNKRLEELEDGASDLEGAFATHRDGAKQPSTIDEARALRRDAFTRDPVSTLDAARQHRRDPDADERPRTIDEARARRLDGADFPRTLAEARARRLGRGHLRR